MIGNSDTIITYLSSYLSSNICNSLRRVFASKVYYIAIIFLILRQFRGIYLFWLKIGSLEFMIDYKVGTVDIDMGSYVMIHAGTKHGIIAVTDCNMITVGCVV